MPNHRHLWLFAFILLLAALLRFYQLGQVPAFLNRDEASLAYNAYSLLKTGQEEHGVAWPVNLESFGDWKLSGYVYSLIPFLAAFGLEAWVIRLPAALAGIGVVVLSYGLSRQLFGRQRQGLALLVMALAAINPWSIHLSRIAYEANLAMFFFLLAFYLLNFSRENKQRCAWFPLAIFFFLAAMLTYHSYQLVVPVFALFYVVLHWRSFWQRAVANKKVFALATVLLGLGLALILGSNSQSANTVKFRGLSIFDKNQAASAQFQDKLYFGDPNSLLAKLYGNSYLAMGKQLIDNYYRVFAGHFNNITGGSHGSHNISNEANFYVFEYPLFLLGIYLLWRRREKPAALISAALLITALPAVITFQPEHSTRFSASLFFWLLPTALAIEQIYPTLKKRTWLAKLFIPALAIIYLLALAHYLLSYYIVAPKKDLDRADWYMPLLVEKVNRLQNQYQQVVLPFASSSPYIYFLFYQKADPALAQQQLQYYPADEEGFRHVKQLNKLVFTSGVEWSKANSPATLYVIEAAAVPEEVLTSKHYQILDSIKNPWSDRVFYLLGSP